MPAPIPPSDVVGGTAATSAWANAVSDAIQQLIVDLYPLGALSLGWAQITGKPATFAPTVHAHADDPSGGLLTYANLTGKPTALAPTAHAHADTASGGSVPYANLTGKPTTMDPTAHAHAGGGDGGTVPYGNLTGKPSTFAPANHALDPASGPHTGTLPYASVSGKPATFAPADHAAAHRAGGSDPIGAAAMNAWVRQAAGDTLGTKIYCGTGVPSGMAEGDIWIIG